MANSSLTLTSTNISCSYYGDIKYPDISVAVFIVAIVGFCVNLLAIFVLKRRRIISNFNRLLILLAYFDVAFILLYLLDQFILLLDYFIKREENTSIINSRIYPTLYVYFIYPLQHIFLTSTVIMITIISIDRYVAVLHPFLADARGRFWMTVLTGPSQSTLGLYALSVMAFATIICFPHFFDHKVVSEDKLYFVALHWKRNFMYCLIYRTFIDLVVRFFFPLFIIRKTYGQIFRVVQAHEPNEKMWTLFCSIIVFLVCSCGEVILSIVEVAKFEEIMLCGSLRVPGWEVTLNLAGNQLARTLKKGQYSKV